jgi:hypothetical protein
MEPKKAGPSGPAPAMESADEAASLQRAGDADASGHASPMRLGAAAVVLAEMNEVPAAITVARWKATFQAAEQPAQPNSEALREAPLEEFITSLGHTHGWKLDSKIEPAIIGCWCGVKVDGLDEFNEHLRAALAQPNAGASPAAGDADGKLADLLGLQFNPPVFSDAAAVSPGGVGDEKRAKTTR